MKFKTYEIEFRFIYTIRERNRLISNIKYVYWMLNMKNIVGNNQDIFFVYIPNYKLEMFGCKQKKKSWLFRAIFSCSASKIIDVRY